MFVNIGNMPWVRGCFLPLLSCWSLSQLSCFPHFHYKLNSFLSLMRSHDGNDLLLVSSQKSEVPACFQSGSLCFLTASGQRFLPSSADELKAAWFTHLLWVSVLHTHSPHCLPQFLLHSFDALQVLAIVFIQGHCGFIKICYMNVLGVYLFYPMSLNYMEKI